MTIDHVLAMSDPARELPADAVDPSSPQALALLERIPLEGPVARPVRHRPVGPRAVRRVVLGGALAGAAAAVVLGAPMPWEHGGSGSVASAYAVTRDGDAVSVTIHWSELSDPAALQAALDRAGARVTVFVRTDPVTCAAPGNTVGYSADAVQWTSPRSDPQDAAFVVRPQLFPSDATFVVSVVVAPAGTVGGSTLAPQLPQVEQIASSMVVGAVSDCAR